MQEYEIRPFDQFAMRCCEFFYDAGKGVNNGYNCKHSNCSEGETINGETIGSCYIWSCPLGYEAEIESFNDPNVDNNSFEPEGDLEGEFIVLKKE